MPLLAGDVLRCSVRFSDVNGNDHVNVYYLRAPFEITDSDATIMAAIADYFDDAYSELATNISNLVTEIDIKIDEVEWVGGVLEVTRNLGTVPWSMTTSPSAAGDPLPPGVAALVKFLTGVGKTYGRKFIGMICEAAQASGIITSGLQSQLASYAGVILAGISGILTGGDLDAGVMSVKIHGFQEYNNYDVSDVVAYQRRRRQGTGS